MTFNFKNGFAVCSHCNRIIPPEETHSILANSWVCIDCFYKLTNTRGVKG